MPQKRSKKRVGRRNKTQEGGSQKLINAVAANHTNKVKEILTTEVDVNYTNNNGSTPLLVACRNGNLDIVRLLLAHGAIVNNPGSNYSALNNAAISGHIDVVNELLDRGANPTWTDTIRSGRGIVERVNTQGNQEMVELLIRKGINNGYTSQHAERDGVLEQYKQINTERRYIMWYVRDRTNLPMDFVHPTHPDAHIMKYFGGKRKTKRSKAKKGSKKRVSRRNKV